MGGQKKENMYKGIIRKTYCTDGTQIGLVEHIDSGRWMCYVIDGDGEDNTVLQAGQRVSFDPALSVMGIETEMEAPMKSSFPETY